MSTGSQPPKRLPNCPSPQPRASPQLRGYQQGRKGEREGAASTELPATFEWLELGGEGRGGGTEPPHTMGLTHAIGLTQYPTWGSWQGGLEARGFHSTTTPLPKLWPFKSSWQLSWLLPPLYPPSLVGSPGDHTGLVLPMRAPAQLHPHTKN